MVGVVIALRLAGCGGSTAQWSEPADEVAAVEPPPESTSAPVPFSASEIREATPAGRTMRVRLESNGEVQYQRWRFEEADLEGFQFSVTETDAEGQPTGEPQSSEGTWEGLESHGRFPASHTTIESTEVTTELGTLTVRLYTVNVPERGETHRFWFADDLPGAPVQMTVDAGEQRVSSMRILSNETPSSLATQKAAQFEATFHCPAGFRVVPAGERGEAPSEIELRSADGSLDAVYWFFERMPEMFAIPGLLESTLAAAALNASDGEALTQVEAPPRPALAADRAAAVGFQPGPHYSPRDHGHMWAVAKGAKVIFIALIFDTAPDPSLHERALSAVSFDENNLGTR